MEEQAYRESVISLMNGDLTFNEKLGNFALGLVCETGEVIQAIRSNPSRGNIASPKIVDEFSDCRWYFTASAIELDIPDYLFMYAENKNYYPDPDSDKLYNLFISATKYGDMIKKVIYHKHPLKQHYSDLAAFLFQYYVYYRKRLNDYTLTDAYIKQYNYDKLNARYKGLKFTTEQSINRDNEIRVGGHPDC